MLTLEQIRHALQDRRIDIVSEATGLNYGTVRKIREGTNTNPGWKTLQALSNYLEGREVGRGVVE
jgi:hypothetical protein